MKMFVLASNDDSVLNGDVCEDGRCVSRVM
jgi:hypothetical protein